MKASVINQLCKDYHEKICFEFLKAKNNQFISLCAELSINYRKLNKLCQWGAQLAGTLGDCKLGRLSGKQGRPKK